MPVREEYEDWETVQARYADVPGVEGLQARGKCYPPYFLRFGRNVSIGEGCRFTHPDRIVLDDDVRINTGALLYGSGGIWIGRHARIGPRCFIHSANHDVDASCLAYFERGYSEAAVCIGDLSLISANVSILPGATLGAGSFVACGAVVARGDYEDGSKLFGVPARANSAAPRVVRQPRPEIAVIIPADARWRDLGRQLLTVLGLPQAMLFDEGSEMPDSVRNALLLGPRDWGPATPDEVGRWTISDGTVEGTPQDLPTFRPFPVVRSVSQDGDPPYAHGLERAGFWVINRLEKGTGALGLREFREWVTSLRCLPIDEFGYSRWAARLVEQLLKRVPPELANISGPGVKDLDAWLDQMARRAELAALPLVARLRERVSPRVGLSSQAALRDPEQLVRAARRGRLDASTYTEMLLRMLENSQSGLRLCAFGIAAHLIGDDGAYELIRSTVGGAEWKAPGIALPRAARNKEVLCMSPLALVYGLIVAMREAPGFAINEGFARQAEGGQTLRWRGFENGELIDRVNKRVARCLVDNWMILHSAPCPPGTQFCLSDATYGVGTIGLERAWLAVFRAMQAASGRPLVRLRPWPEGYRAALSIRYDVDRPIAAQRISELVVIQARHANAPCANWYYFVGHADRERQGPQLRRHWQESGLHVESADGPLSGEAITHHSAPMSEYWQGDGTNVRLAAAGACAAEFLASHLATPRPVWLPRFSSDPQRCLWIVPLHFPIEGATDDRTLRYFDRRLAHFRDMIAAGGHVIVGGHPDLDPQLMRDLLTREYREDLWFATIGRVIERVRAVMSPGHTCAESEGANIMLVSVGSLADLVVEIWRPNREEPDTTTTQLIRGTPRAVAPVEV